MFTRNPDHPPDEPFDTEDVISVARRYFANDRLYKPLQRRARGEPRGRSKTCQRNPDKLIQRLFGDDRGSGKPARDDSESDSESDKEAPTMPERPTYETKSVRFRDQRSGQARSDDNIGTKLKSLSVCEPSYLPLYSQCQECFPHVVRRLPKPDLFATQAPPAAATVAYQSSPASARQPWAQRMTTPPASVTPPTDTSEGDAFFSDRNGIQTRGCTFCGVLGHRIRGCPAAQEYYRTGCVKIISNRLHLPTGEPMPNDGRGLGLKASLDAWLAANAQPPSDATMPSPQRDPPPHATSYSFEISPEPRALAGAYIAEGADSDSGSNNDAYTPELYDMYEVFATKKKDSKPSETPVSTQASLPSPPPAAPSTSTGRTPQYRYQASAEDQTLTKELLTWILEGTLDKVTPAHILAASPPVRKELIERWKPRHVETASFEQAYDDEPVSVLELAAKQEAKFSLPLREIDVLVNSCKTEAGVLDQGSQIVVMREDLANEVGAHINTQCTLHMEEASGSTSRTLGCAEDLCKSVMSPLPFMLMLSVQHRFASCLDAHSTTSSYADLRITPIALTCQFVTQQILFAPSLFHRELVRLLRSVCHHPCLPSPPRAPTHGSSRALCYLHNPSLP